MTDTIPDAYEPCEITRCIRLLERVYQSYFDELRHCLIEADALFDYADTMTPEYYVNYRNRVKHLRLMLEDLKMCYDNKFTRNVEELLKVDIDHEIAEAEAKKFLEKIDKKMKKLEEWSQKVSKPRKT